AAFAACCSGAALTPPGPRPRPGDRVALVIRTRWPLVVGVPGGLKAGLTVAPLDPLLKREELAEILADLKATLVLDDIAAESAGWTTREAPPAAALLLYTSGSTARPKGALLSHAAVEFAQRSWAGPVMELTPDDVVLAALPLSHSFGLNGALLAPLLVGSTVRLVERFTPDGVASLLKREAISVFPGVATMFRRLLDLPAFADTRLRLAVSGAAPADGWFRTGDLATIDRDGWVRITGRKRERILRAGHSIFPPEVEAMLLTHPDVAEAAVIGVPHAELGEEVAAFVVLRGNARATTNDLIAYCRERLAGYKYPRRV